MFLFKRFLRFELNVLSLDTNSAFVCKLEKKIEFLKSFEFVINSEELLQ